MQNFNRDPRICMPTDKYLTTKSFMQLKGYSAVTLSDQYDFLF